jgi:hypothetical protein
MKCTVDVGSGSKINIRVPSFMLRLRFFLSNFKGCNVGITDGLQIAPSKRLKMALCYTFQVP